MRLNDDIFGKLTYMRSRTGAAGYWEAQSYFEPCNREVESFVNAPGPYQPPTDAQRAFFSFLKGQYEDIRSRAEAAFRLDEHAARGRYGRFEDFCLSGFSVPLCQGENEDWDVSFESSSGVGCLFTVKFSGLALSVVSIEFEID